MKALNDMYVVKIGEANREGWSHLIIAIDFYGVLVPSEDYHAAVGAGANVKQAIKDSINPLCIIPLQKMSIRKDIKLSLYTSVKKDIRQLIVDAFLELYGIEFDYLNSSNLNLEPTRASQDFLKPYCDILLDSAAGFEYGDWTDLGVVINNYYIIPKHGDSSRETN